MNAKEGSQIAVISADVPMKVHPNALGNVMAEVNVRMPHTRDVIEAMISTPVRTRNLELEHFCLSSFLKHAMSSAKLMGALINKFLVWLSDIYALLLTIIMKNGITKQ